MNDSESKEGNLSQLKIRVQNLKVLLEEAVLSGSHHRSKQLLADIKQVEEEMTVQRERDDNNP